MTSPTPFARVSAGDAEPVPLTSLAQATATSPLADPPRPAGLSSSGRYCEFCDAPLTGMKKRCCGSDACLRAMDRAQVASWALRDETRIAAMPSKADPAAKAFAGLSFTDDPRAVKREAYLRMLPEPSRSGTGCAAAMCAMARPT